MLPALPDAPLMTLNTADFSDFAAHHSLVLLSEQL